VQRHFAGKPDQKPKANGSFCLLIRPFNVRPSSIFRISCNPSRFHEICRQLEINMLPLLPPLQRFRISERFFSFSGSFQHTSPHSTCARTSSLATFPCPAQFRLISMAKVAKVAATAARARCGFFLWCDCCRTVFAAPVAAHAQLAKANAGPRYLTASWASLPHSTLVRKLVLFEEYFEKVFTSWVLLAIGNTNICQINSTHRCCFKLWNMFFRTHQMLTNHKLIIENLYHMKSLFSIHCL